ncbi:hypothetical protein [Nakamurella leprariae]|uniref:Uncharacterized protein n=1 Tax=Nakamurella leprariae TaxID=2803911 RepID=A0A938YJL5_9ACTN|nr:hypothetical protein [Nakamurella leprariae]MBM9469068.1 hypothetical protein [Nakamurella leprariae]
MADTPAPHDPQSSAPDGRFDELLAAAGSYLGSATRIIRGDLRMIAGLLQPGERVLALAMGQLEGRARMVPQLVTATDRRILLTQRRVTPIGRDWVQEVAWDDVRSASVQGDVGFLSTTAATWRLTKAMPLHAFEVIDRFRGDSRGAPAPTAPPPLAPRSERLADAGDDVHLDGVARRDVDGVPVFWPERRSGIPGVLRARLVFGVGIRDEAFPRTGITRLVARLIEQTAVRTGVALPIAMSVDAHLTTLEVAGADVAVADAIERLSRAVAVLDVSGLGQEWRELTTSPVPRPDLGTAEWLPAFSRFGNRGVGLLAAAELAPHTSTVDDVITWARRWFHRDNAALVLDDAPPAGLRLPVPAPRGRWWPGVHDAADLLDPVAGPVPGWTPAEDAVLLSVFDAWTPELAVGWAVLEQRLRARVPDVAMAVTVLPVSGDRVVASLGASVDTGSAGTVAAAVQQAIANLPSRPVTSAEVGAVADRSPDSVDAALAQAAAHLMDLTVPVAHPDVSVEPWAVDEALQTALDTAVLAVPPAAAPTDLPALDSSGGPVVTGVPFQRALLGSAVPRGSEMVAGEEGLSVRSGDSQTWTTVRYRDVVGLRIEQIGPGDEVLMLVVGSGPSLIWRAKDWRKGALAVAEAIRKAVPVDRHYRLPS